MDTLFFLVSSLKNFYYITNLLSNFLYQNAHIFLLPSPSLLKRNSVNRKKILKPTRRGKEDHRRHYLDRRQRRWWRQAKESEEILDSIGLREETSKRKEKLGI